MTSRGPWVFVIVAAAILMVTMGARQSMGLFLSPLNTHTGLGIATHQLRHGGRAARLGGGAAGVRRHGRPLGSRPGHRARARCCLPPAAR